MKRVLFFLVVISLVGFVVAVFDSTPPWHNADEVIISVDGRTITLQEAIDRNFLKDGVGFGDNTFMSNAKKGHSAESINIYLGKSNNYSSEGQITLQDAINGEKSLCREHGPFANWAIGFTGHGASDVMISVDGEDMTLQDAIGSAKFCSYNLVPLEWGECSSNCGEGIQLRDTFCQRSDGKSPMDSSFCQGLEIATEQPCFSTKGPVCGFSDWEETSTCSETACGKGTLQRTRVCNIEGSCNGPFSDFNGGVCYTWTYSWVAGGWYDSSIAIFCEPQHPSCYSISKTKGENRRDVWCQRCDGQKVADSYCGGGKPSTTQPCSPQRCAPSGGGGGTTVLCTEAYNQGYLSEELYHADVLYSKENVDEITLIGYYSWAEPLVRVMKDSPEISNSAMPLVVEWAKQMAYLMDVTKEGSEVGKILIDVGMPICNKLGILLVNDGYSKNNNYEFDEEFIEEISLKYIEKGTFSIDNLSSGGEEKFRSDLEEFFSEIEAELFLQKYL